MHSIPIPARPRAIGTESPINHRTRALRATVRYPLWPADCSTLSATSDGLHWLIALERTWVLPVLCGSQQESWGECLERNTACCEGNNHLTRPRTASKHRANPKCKFVFLYFKFHIFNVSDNLVSEWRKGVAAGGRVGYADQPGLAWCPKQARCPKLTRCHKMHPKWKKTQFGVDSLKKGRCPKWK